MTMDYLGSYRPTEVDRKFAEWIVGHVKDGGLWAVPINGAGFRVHHNAGGKGGRLVLVDDDECDDELFSRTKAVFALVGYSVFRRGESSAGSAAAESL